MNKLFILLLLTIPVYSQAVRIDPLPASTVSTNTPPGAFTPILAIPGATISLFNYGTTTLATTYTDATATTTCPSDAQAVPAGTSGCVSTTDAQGNFGFWVIGGSYAYTLNVNGNSFGPYPVSNGVSAFSPQPANTINGKLNFIPYVTATDTNFTALSPGGTLAASTPASKTVTCPQGVAGTDTGHYLYISGGSGTAEAVLITGGSCATTGTIGTINFTPANNHSGAWTITSATSGIQEAVCSEGIAKNAVPDVPPGNYTLNANVSFCGHSYGELILEDGAVVGGTGTFPTSVGYGYTITDKRQNTATANLSWSQYQYRANIPAYNYEYQSIIINDHDYRANTGVPRNSFYSTGSALLVGWTTPTNGACTGCTGGNEQDGITISMLQMNSITPMVGLVMKNNPGVDNWNGIWGFNINTSNNGHSNASSQTGLFGGEINIGVSAPATDTPTPGVGSQVIGLDITESSGAGNVRTSALLGLISSGLNNAHNGIYINANPSGTHSMDHGIQMSGSIQQAIDLTGVVGGVNSIILPSSGGLGIVDQAAAPQRVIFHDSANNLFLNSISSTASVIVRSFAGNVLAIFADGGGFVPTTVTFAALPAGAGPGSQFFCSNCNTATSPCTTGGTGALAVRQNGAYKCL